jgi:putative ABC transport system permease protein
MKLAGLALRNLRRQKKRTVFLILAIAISSMLSAILYSFSGGILANMTENASNIFAGHMYVSGKERLENGKTVDYIKDGQRLIEMIDESGLEYSSIAVRTEIGRATLYYEGNSVWQSIVGFSREKETSFLERVPFKEGSFTGLELENGIIISTKTAEKLKVNLNDIITAKIRTVKGQYNAGDFKIAGIIENVDLFGVSTSYVNLGYLNKLAGLEENQFQSLGIYFDSLDVVERNADVLYEKFSAELNFFPREDEKEKNDSIYAMFMPRSDDYWEGVKYELETINDRMKDIREAERIIKIVTTIVMMFIYLVICVGIGNTFSIVMIERFKEIGTMRALGMQSRSVAGLFINEAMFMSIIGVVSGLTAGAFLMTVVSLIPFGTSGPLFLFLKNGHFSFRPDVFWIGLNTFLIVFFTFLSIIGTAVRAAKLQPAVALRSAK